MVQNDRSPVHLDPSHLLALHALLQEGSVTRAARRLAITQSSMSHRLAQLRQQLGDPLLVRVGAALVPTPRAKAMAEPLAAALQALDEAVAPPAAFDPKSARFALSLVMPDLLAALGPELVAGLAREAPGVQLRMVGVMPDLATNLSGAERSLALVPARFVGDDMQTRSLGELSFAVAGRKRHPAFRGALTIPRWLAHPHVVVKLGNDRTNVIDDELGRRGLSRRVGLEVPSFLAGLLSVARSELLMNVPVPLVNDAVKVFGLSLRDAPLPLPRLRFVLAWHARFQHDAPHRWVRERVLTAVRRAFAT